ncbi:MAG: hypothetical protein ACOVP4_06280 [Bacteriovoracaceae bacterium]
MKLVLFLFTILLSHSLLALEEKTIHIEGQSNGAWTSFSSSDELNMKRLFALLSRSETGEKLLRLAKYKAGQNGETLSDVIKVGNGSLTDTTLVRKFSPQSPEHVVFESRSVVYINKNLSWDDALLDLSHELTHYVYRSSFNPYGPDFNAKDFIKSTIEGEGGEVQAFLMECRVLRELFSRQVQGRSHCQKITDDAGRLSSAKAVELFYDVGEYFDKFGTQLKGRGLAGELEHIKGTKINFISSAYGVPYPMAALMEYDLVVEKVCENDKKRLAYMQQGPKRGPASVDTRFEQFKSSYQSRCK